MKIMDEVEVIAEKEKYAKHGVHKGMQAVIWDERNSSKTTVIGRYLNCTHNSKPQRH